MNQPKTQAFWYLSKLQRAIELIRIAEDHGSQIRNGELILTLLEVVDVYLARKFTEEFEAAHESS